MTEEEKQRERECKAECCKKLAGINIRSYGLDQIDKRLRSYAEGVISDFSAHNLYECLALARFFRFLDKYEFRIDELQKFILCYEHLKFPGTHGRQSYKLTPVQVFEFANILGFYKDKTHRLTHNVILYVPRKFSKTTSVAALAIYDLLYGDANAQAYTAANTYKQAMICFKAIKGAIKGLDQKLLHFKVNRDMVSWREDQARESFIQCLTSNADKLDGLNASTVIMDEFSQAETTDLYHVLTTSMGIRENPLVIVITTASDKPDAPFVEMLNGAKSTLRGEVEDDALFAHIFEPDVDDKEGDPHTWRKVQPHMGITVKESFYENMWAEAQKTHDDMKAFRTKLLNVYDTASGQTWITGKEIMDHYRKLDIDKLGTNSTGRKNDCEVAVDLSVDNDFSAVSYYVYLYDEKKSHIHTEFYFPEGKLKSHPNRDLYKRWAKQGYLHLCKGKIIDYYQIATDILKHGQNLRIMKIAYDPNKAQDFTNILVAYGAKNYLYPYKQTNYYYTIPVQALPRMLEQNVLTFTPNPIISYCFDNCTLDVDSMENCRPIKKEANHKIDGAITATMAVGVSLQQKRF
ncbi:MAG: terminase large subunit [Prevotella sp.]|jgi:phage terminase large subunit-like protein|nr:terminase large subunit [Prevotella sp.]